MLQFNLWLCKQIRLCSLTRKMENVNTRVKIWHAQYMEFWLVQYAFNEHSLKFPSVRCRLMLNFILIFEISTWKERHKKYVLFLLLLVQNFSFLNLQARIILVITVLCKSCHILIRILLEMSTALSLSWKGWN